MTQYTASSGDSHPAGAGSASNGDAHLVAASGAVEERRSSGSLGLCPTVADSSTGSDAHPTPQPEASGSDAQSGVGQPADGEHAVARSAKASASRDHSGVEQLAARSKNEEDAQPRKRLCLGAPGVGVASRTAVPVSVGAHHTDIANMSFDDCKKTITKAQEHLEALKEMLPDVKKRPSQCRINELVERLGVPQHADGQTLPLDLVFQRVQQKFREKVSELQNNW